MPPPAATGTVGGLPWSSASCSEYDSQPNDSPGASSTENSVANGRPDPMRVGATTCAPPGGRWVGREGARADDGFHLLTPEGGAVQPARDGPVPVPQLARRVLQPGVVHIGRSGWERGVLGRAGARVAHPRADELIQAGLRQRRHRLGRGHRTPFHQQQKLPQHRVRVSSGGRGGGLGVVAAHGGGQRLAVKEQAAPALGVGDGKGVLQHELGPLVRLRPVRRLEERARVQQAALAGVLVRERAVQVDVGGGAEAKRVQDRRVGALDDSRACQLKGRARFAHRVVVGDTRWRRSCVGPIVSNTLAMPRPAVEGL
eukprot:scaffold2072_cov126-Isochrysis_galbana.AAC.12